MAIIITPTSEQVDIWKGYNPLHVEACTNKRIKHVQRVIHWFGTNGEGTVWDIWKCHGCDYQCMSTPGNVSFDWKRIAENMPLLRVQHPTRRKRLHGLQMQLKYKQKELAKLKAKIVEERAK